MITEEKMEEIKKMYPSKIVADIIEGWAPKFSKPLKNFKYPIGLSFKAYEFPDIIDDRPLIKGQYIIEIGDKSTPEFLKFKIKETQITLEKGKIPNTAKAGLYEVDIRITDQ